MDKFNLSGGVALRSAYGLPARNAAAPASYTTPWDAATAVGFHGRRDQRRLCLMERKASREDGIIASFEQPDEDRKSVV